MCLRCRACVHEHCACAACACPACARAHHSTSERRRAEADRAEQEALLANTRQRMESRLREDAARRAAAAAAAAAPPPAAPGAARRPETHYEALGVPRPRRGAALDEAAVRRRYREMALRHHPDKNPHDAAAPDRFRRIAEAHAVLSDAARRAEYDRGLEALDSG